MVRLHDENRIEAIEMLNNYAFKICKLVLAVHVNLQGIKSKNLLLTVYKIMLHDLDAMKK